MVKKHKENEGSSSAMQDMEHVINMINQQVSEASKELQDQLFADSMPNPMQTEQQRAAKCQHDANQVFNALQTDIKRGIECYMNYALSSEQRELGKFFSKIFVYTQTAAKQNTPFALNEEDVNLLDNIATRTFSESHCKEASCMWRLIIQLDPTNSRAWVGWALAEQKNKNIECVEQIFRLGLELLPYNVYLALFAADFYMSENKIPIARGIIHKTNETLKGIEGATPESYEALNQKLIEIEKFEQALMKLS